MSTPAISVLMSVYNTARYVAEAVESILAQTFREFEFIIINDGSTDGSEKILRGLAERDTRIRLEGDVDVARLQSVLAAVRRLGGLSTWDVGFDSAKQTLRPPGLAV